MLTRVKESSQNKIMAEDCFFGNCLLKDGGVCFVAKCNLYCTGKDDPMSSL